MSTSPAERSSTSAVGQIALVDLLTVLVHQMHLPERLWRRALVVGVTLEARRPDQ